MPPRWFVPLIVCSLAAWPVTGQCQDVRDSAGVRLVHYPRSAKPRATWTLSARAFGGRTWAPLAPATRHTWSVFAPDGTWRADVTLLPRFVPFDFGRDDVAGVAFDADDVERVVVWGLRR